MKGIYKITNKTNNKIYIGSSKNIFKRWESHISDLLNKNHHSYKLQNDFNKYGINEFTFEIVELLDFKDSLLNKEQYWIDTTESYEDSIGYNVCTFTNYKNISNLNKFDNKKYKINVLDDKINVIGEDQFDLSKSWFLKNPEKVIKLKNSILNYFKQKIKVKSNDEYWTSFINVQRKLSAKGCQKGFLPLNALIDEDKRRNNLCFAANCFINPFVKRLYAENNIEIKDEEYSLCILLNWITNVVDINKPINIYIPSKRMREILVKWLDK